MAQNSSRVRQVANLLHIVHSRDGGLSLRFLRVANKAESTTSTSVSVLNYNLDRRSINVEMW